jgi:hypothetical protein
MLTSAIGEILMPSVYNNVTLKYLHNLKLCTSGNKYLDKLFRILALVLVFFLSKIKLTQENEITI